MRRIRSHLSYANVISTLCLFLLLTGGTAVALSGSNTVFTDDVANDTQPASGGNPAGGLAAPDLRPNAVGASETAPNSVGTSEVADGSIGSGEVADGSIGTGEVADFNLTNQDVGVLFAEVNANGTLANSSGGVTSNPAQFQGTGRYHVDFGRDVSACTAVATIGPFNATEAQGEVNVADRAGTFGGGIGHVEEVLVDTNTSAGAAATRPFRLVVVC